MAITHEKTCSHEVSNANSVDPSFPYCDLADGHGGPHRYVCAHEVSDGNRDDPTYYYCKLPGFHAGAHEYNF